MNTTVAVGQAVEAWWDRARSRFPAGASYPAGMEIGKENLLRTLREGKQPNAGSPLFV